MKVWLVWTGEYSDASVVGVYSTRELAEAATHMYGDAFSAKPDGYVDNDDGYEVDADAVMVRAGTARWRLSMNMDDGAISYIYRTHPGTGEPPLVSRQRLPPFDDAAPVGPELRIECDARDRDHAIKIAGDERAKYIARLNTHV